MGKIVVLWKRLRDNAVAPFRTHDGDAGWDLTAVNTPEDTLEFLKGKAVGSSMQTGIAVAIPKGYFGILCARSSVWKKGISLANGVGVIDSGYRGEIIANFYGDNHYRSGDKCCQLVIMPAHPDEVEFKEVDELPESWDGRGESGFGSTDSDVLDVDGAGIPTLRIGTVRKYKGRDIVLKEGGKMDCEDCVLLDNSGEFCINAYGYCGPLERSDGKECHWEWLDNG